MKRVHKLQVLLILALCLSLLPLGSQGEAASLSPFRDVADSHWAFPHIIKMEARGVIAGYDDQTFRPENTVTQLEAIIMAIRAMGLTEEAKQTNGSHLVSVYNIPTGWNAEGYVALALNKGLIDADNFRPNMGASRSWIAQLTVRMIGAQAELTNATATSFADDSFIPIVLKPYVALTAQKEIITGIRNTQGQLEFKPNQLVTRAQLATIINRSEAYMPASSSLLPIGKITSIDGQHLHLENAAGAIQGFILDSNLLVIDGQKKVSSRTALAKDMYIEYAANQATIVKYIEVSTKQDFRTTQPNTGNQPGTNVGTGSTGGGGSSADLSGSIIQHYDQDRLLIIQDTQGMLHTYSYADNVQVKLDKTGTKRSVVDLYLGATVKLTIKDDLITEISITSDSAEGITKGKIYALDFNRNLVTLVQNNRYSSYSLATNVLVEYEGVRFPSVHNLKAGDEVEISLVEQKIDTIRVLNPNQLDSAQGRVVNISTDNQIITLRLTDGSLQAYDLDSSVKVTVQGLNNSRLSDIETNDDVLFTTRNGKIDTLEVTSRKYAGDIQGKIITVDSKRELLTIENDDKEYKTYELDRNVYLDLDTKHSPTLSDLKEGMRVSLKLYKNTVLEVSLHNKAEGEIIDLDKNRHLITINTKDGRTNYRIDRDVDVYLVDITRPDLDDLQIGDYAILTLGDNLVKKIELKEVRTYILTEVDTNRNRVKIKNDRNSERTETIRSATKLVIPGLSRPKLADFHKGNSVQMTFVAGELEEMKLLAATYGFIQSIDTARNKLVLNTLPHTKEIELNSKLYAYDSTGRSMSSRNLAEDDYVKIIEQGSEYHLTQTSSLEAEFYNVDDLRLYFYDKDRRFRSFVYADDVEVWKGTTRLNLKDIRAKNKLILYTMNDEIIAVQVK